jgi:hypothetical protein
VKRWEDKKRDGNHSPHKTKLIQDSEGNKENGYPVPDSKKQRQTMTRNPVKPKRTFERRNPASNH